MSAANDVPQKDEAPRLEDQRFFKDLMEKSRGKMTKKFLITFYCTHVTNVVNSYMINLMLQRHVDGSIEIENLERFAFYQNFFGFKKFSSTVLGITFWHLDTPIKLVLRDGFCKQFVVTTDADYIVTVKVEEVVTLK